MVDNIDLEGLRRLLNAPLWKAEEGDYAELVDENDEDGAVVIRRKSGAPVAMMPREVWDQLLTWKEE